MWEPTPKRLAVISELIQRVLRCDVDAHRPHETIEQRENAQRCLHEAVGELDDALWPLRQSGETVQQVRERLAPQIWP